MIVSASKGISSPPRINFARTTPRPCRWARTESGCSATSRFVTTTSSVAIGKSRSAGSSTSSRSGRLPLSSTLRRAPMATTSPDCSTVSGVASMSSAPRRMRSTKTRSGLAERSRSATVRPAETSASRYARMLHSLYARCTPSSEASTSRRHLRRQFPALRLHVDAKQAWSHGRQKPDDESCAHQVADRIGHRDVVLQSRLLGLWQIEPVDRVAGGPDHRRFGERAGHQACRRPGVVAKQLAPPRASSPDSSRRARPSARPGEAHSSSSRERTEARPCSRWQTGRARRRPT